MLWSKSFTPAIAEELENNGSASSSANPVDALIRQTFVEERTADQRFDKDGYTLRWTFANDLELTFVVS